MDTFTTYNKKLAGFKDVSETVKIIEKIAAGQLHSLEQATVSLATYTQNVLIVLSRIQQLSNNSVSNTISTTKKSLLIVFTGDKGLVGDLWRRIFSMCTDDRQQDILVVGKKGQQQWPESEESVTHYSFVNRIPAEDELYAFASMLDGYLNKGVYNIVSTLHPHPVSLVEQNPVLTQLLPIDVSKIELAVSDTTASDYPIVQGSLQSLQKMLYKKYLASRLQQIILETAVSEYSARTVLMEHAGSKTNEASDRLSMVYSRDKRQRETQKQLERFATKHTAI